MKREECRPDDSLNQALRKSFQELEAARGPCPAPAQLVKYQAGELGPGESTPILHHIILCGACELYVERLEDFDSVAIATGEAGPLRQDVRRALQISRMGPSWKVGIGYAVALLLAYPAYKGLFSAAPAGQTEVSRTLQSAVAPVRTFELPETRPASKQPAIIDLRPGEERFSLSFFVPGRNGGRFTAEMRDWADKMIGVATTVTPTSLGGATLLCERAAFRSGRYKLTITEVPSAESAAIRQFDYRFEVRLPPRE
jgi:hypothetical protein